MNIKFVKVGERHLKRLNQIVNNPETARFLSMTPPCSMKATIEWYNIQKRNKNPWWAIVCDDEIAGSFNLMHKGSGHAKKKLGHVVEFGISIDRPYWNLGLGKEAILYAKKEAKKRGFKRLELHVIKTNRRALGLYKKCGFKTEGTMKKFYRLGNRYHDAIMMSLWIK